MHSTYHPSMAPGAIIGYRKNGAPIRLIAGGSGEGDGDGTTTSQDGGDAGTGQTSTGDQAGGQEPPVTTTSTGAATATAGDGDQTAKVIEAIRGDYKAERTKRQQLEKDLAAIRDAQVQRDDETKARNLALAKALGLQVDETPDPEKLAAELAAERKAKQDAIDASTARERELTVELNLMRQAAKHGANPELLADSRTFMAKVAKLDPSSDSFGDDLGDAIKTAVEANPAYKLAQATAPAKPAASDGQGDGAGSSGGNGSKTTAPPARSGGEHNGSAGGQRQWTMDDVNRLPRNRKGAAQLQEAIDAGYLAELGYGPGKKSRR